MEEKQTILIVEDDKYIIHFISMSLKEENYTFWTAKTVKEALSLFYANRPDLVILDLGLPDGDGLDVVRNIREIAFTPIIVVSARQEEPEKIRLLDAGADDYVTKPFYMGELLARIRVLLRKPAEAPKTCYKVADLEVHMDTQQVKRGGKDIKLSGKEFALLRYMVQNEGIVLSRDRLEQHLWNFDYAGGSNVIDVYIRYLRKKIDEGYEQKLIHTVRGAGYVLRAEP